MSAPTRVESKPERKWNQRQFKNILINPKYQMKYILWLSATAVLLAGVHSYIFYFYIKENYTILVDLAPMTDQAKQQLYSELHRIVLTLGFFSLGFLALVALAGLLLSHRTVGPLYQLKKMFNRVKEGDLSARVHLRPLDDFHDVADSFNQMMDSISKRVK